MQVWRLMAHHKESKETLQKMKKTCWLATTWLDLNAVPDLALKGMKDNSRIAIGWPSLGKLSNSTLQNSSDFLRIFKQTNPNATNASMARPSLRRFFGKIKIGDLVIVSANGKRKCVFKVTGLYEYDKDNPICGYTHQRAAILTTINPNKLWKECGSGVAKGENIRWALVKCKKDIQEEQLSPFTVL